MECIEWIDSGLHIDEVWASLEVYRSVAREWDGTVTTIGFPIYEDEDRVVLALSRDHQRDCYFGAQLILKSCIKKRDILMSAA